MISGEQRDKVDGEFDPVPETYFSTTCNINLNYFIFNYLGIDATYSLYRITKAEHKRVKESLKLYNHKTLDVGLILRYIKYDYARKYYSFYIAGGATYSDITFENDFKELIGFEPAEISPEWGWYGKAGVRYNFNEFIFVGISIKYSFLNNYIDTTKSNFDGYYLGVPFYIGLSL